MFGFKKKSTMTLDEIVVAHMNKKYDDEFTLYAASYADFYNGLDVFQLKCKRFPNVKILVDHTSNGIISDNYLSYVYDNQHRELLKKIMTDLLGECIVYTHISKFPVNLSSDLTFEQYKTEINACLSAEVNIKPDEDFEFEEFLKKYISKLKELKLLQGKLYINVFKNSVDYEMLNPNAYTKLPGLNLNYYSKRHCVILTEDYSIYTKNTDVY
ncbi:MAG: hypothetical protein HUJ68_00415 [Clostridia bacterium]|nr:hypothetical protein [Clostridia bacterium]